MFLRMRHIFTVVLGIWYELSEKWNHGLSWAKHGFWIHRLSWIEQGLRWRLFRLTLRLGTYIPVWWVHDWKCLTGRSRSCRYSDQEEVADHATFSLLMLKENDWSASR